LQPTGYDWEFVPVAGSTFTDSGSAACVGQAPSVPGLSNLALVVLAMSMLTLGTLVALRRPSAAG